MNDKERRINFIIETLLPYKEDPQLCAYDGSHCLYLTKDGKKCAVGRWLKDGEWQDLRGEVSSLFCAYDMNDILMDEAKVVGLNVNQWAAIQMYHDCFVGNDVSYKSINSCVDMIIHMCHLDDGDLDVLKVSPDYKSFNHICST